MSGEVSQQVDADRYFGVPEPGQLVSVRRRQWIVADVEASEAEGLAQQQHLIKLASIDDDGLGEELEVIWEIEPGAHVIEKQGMPYADGFDDTETLEAFLDAVRWGAATNADKGFLQAPYRSGVSIETFQLDPLARAVEMARVNLLIADDVGLGKTIEAGLVIQEMLIRHRARSVLVICPASLQEKWRVEMLEKFGLEFRIVDTEYIRKLRRSRGIHANPWSSFPRLITSMDWAKSGEAMRLFKDVLPARASYPRKFDIMLVDEAHNVAPAGAGRYALESQRTALIKLLSPHFQHKLFLTATPHNGYKESFTSLLSLLDDQRFSKGVDPDEKQLAQVMVRRLKTELVDEDNKPIYPTRSLKALEVAYTEEERGIHRLLASYCESREREEQGKGSATQFVNRLLKKRLLSSPSAFASTLAKHRESLESGPKVAKAAPLDERRLRKAIQKADEDYANDTDAEVARDEAVELATRAQAPVTQEQRDLLQQMESWAQREMHSVDSKATAVINWIEQNLKTGGEWNNRRVILFTEYRTTHQWLFELLAMRGYGGDRLAMLHGGMDQDEREKVKAAFQTHPDDADVRILLATDAASEGIDLQNHCNCLIHLEIPYNPNVMEQRNGRIDRHGQQASEVLIWHPVDAGEGSEVSGHAEDILRSLRKLESMRQDMGSVNPIIAPQMADLIEGGIKEIDTREADARSAKTRRYLKVDRQLKEKIQRLRQRLDETQSDLNLTPERIRKAVSVGLRLAEKPALKAIALKGAPDGTVFEMPLLSGSWARCTEGLRHPHTQVIRPITFDHEVAKGRDDVVLIHLNHRLVQMCLQLMRAEVWAQKDNKKLHRIDVRTLADDQLESPAVLVVSRLVITGGNHHRLHEELTLAGGYLGDKGFRREAAQNVLQSWQETAVEHSASESLFSKLSQQFVQHEAKVMGSVEARSKDRLKTLENTLSNRRQKEISDIHAVLDELAAGIQRELDDSKAPEQIELWKEDERQALTRDVEALKRRLACIPEEKAAEAAAIELRYQGYSERTFPVAVIFLLPASKFGGAG
ncbi:MAG: DISARM system SNF2-like helicase DrmD [Proteobacteria bacterium]|nr:DISARM system SNF2-like helicase DrmD [Pseudomonadota bacterium]